MRITIITTSYPRYLGDGTAPFVKSIAQGLVNLGNDVEVVAPYDVKVEATSPEDIKVHRFRYIWPDQWHIMGHARTLHSDLRLHPAAFLLLPLFLLFSTVRLWRVVTENQSQLIYTHWILPNGVPGAIVSAIKKIPLAISLHGSDVYLAKKNPFFRFVARAIMKRADVVTACSEEMYQDAIKLGAEQKIHLLAWGADPDRFTPDQKSQVEVASLRTANNEIVFSSLGRLVHKKGFHLLLRAMSDVLKVHPSTLLIIGGEGPLRESLLNEARKMGIEKHVTLLGRIPWNQVPDFLHQADVFVLPSIQDERGNVDGLPTVLLEAMSTGKPVIASRIGGVPLVIENDANGLVFEPGDHKSLSDLMIQLVEDKTRMQRLGNEARRSICEKHNWQQVCLTLLSYFDDAIQQKSFTSRLGSMYRRAVWETRNYSSSHGSILDVGCFDGYILNAFESKLMIGIDTTPLPRSNKVKYVQGNGTLLPFPDGIFDAVVCLDTLEHIENDKALADSLLRVLAPGGVLRVSTPSLNLRFGPECITQWISQRWGHHLRRGYTVNELEKLFECDGYTRLIRSWNAPFFRIFYIPLRILLVLLPKFVQRLLAKISKWDSQYPEGNHGFYFVEVRREPNP